MNQRNGSTQAATTTTLPPLPWTLTLDGDDYVLIGNDGITEVYRGTDPDRVHDLYRAAQRATAPANVPGHYSWCAPSECVADADNVIHRSARSSITTAIRPSIGLEVSTQDFYSADEHGRMVPSDEHPAPTVYVCEHGVDGWDLTAAEARHLAQVLLNAADYAAGEFVVSPLDRAAHLIASTLGTTGGDTGEVHASVRVLLDSLVAALTSGRS